MGLFNKITTSILMGLISASLAHQQPVVRRRRAVEVQADNKVGDAHLSEFQEDFFIQRTEDVERLLATGEKSMSMATKTTFKIYLSGPEVFLAEPFLAGERSKAECERANDPDADFYLEAVYPLDSVIENFAPDPDTAFRIYEANIDFMEEAFATASNMIRFRSPSMDVGTAFEMGYIRAQGKPVFGYYDAVPFYGEFEEPGLYKERVFDYGFTSDVTDRYDKDGLEVENFGIGDNLMMWGAYTDSGYSQTENVYQACLNAVDYIKNNIDELMTDPAPVPTVVEEVSSEVTADGKPIYKIYLSGPEVFLAEPFLAGEESKAECEQANDPDADFYLEAVYPLDSVIENFAPDPDTAFRIYEANIDFMEEAFATASNMIRFRSPSMDVGTAFEMGYIRAQGKPVFGYYDAVPFYGEFEEPGLYKERVFDYGFTSDVTDRYDKDGLEVENFGIGDNLMMWGAYTDSGYSQTENVYQACLNAVDYIKTNF